MDSRARIADMRVAIAGSTGMLGQALARHLVGEGHEVIGLVRGRATRTDQRSWDPDGGRIDGPGLEDVDAVVNLTGSPIAGGRWTAERKAEILTSRTGSARTLVAALSPGGRCQRFLSGSATGYYGSTGPEIVDEESPAGTGFLAGVAADWEAAAGQCPGADRTGAHRARPGPARRLPGHAMALVRRRPGRPGR